MNNGVEAGEKTNKIRRIVRYSVTAIASLLFIFVCIEIYAFYRLSSDRLFRENYIPYELPRNGNDSAGSEIERAYSAKKYAEVIKINKNSVLSVTDIFLTGISYLETNDLSKAISNFQVVIADIKDDKTETLKDTAEYYLALAYLKNNDYDQAIDLMNKIHDDPSHLYSKKFSRKYISKIKRLKWR